MKTAARGAYLVSLLLMTSCGRADLERIASDFTAQREFFELLQTLVQEDVGRSSCYAIGTDRIGEYWEFNGKWITNNDFNRKISLAQVLEETGLSNERYEEYLSLFELTGAELVEICPKNPTWTRILVRRSGLSVAGCLTSVNIRGDGSIPHSDVRPGNSSEILRLGDGWYLKHDCT